MCTVIKLHLSDRCITQLAVSSWIMRHIDYKTEHGINSVAVAFELEFFHLNVICTFTICLNGFSRKGPYYDLIRLKFICMFRFIYFPYIKFLGTSIINVQLILSLSYNDILRLNWFDLYNFLLTFLCGNVFYMFL